MSKPIYKNIDGVVNYNLFAIASFELIEDSIKLVFKNQVSEIAFADAATAKASFDDMVSKVSALADGLFYALNANKMINIHDTIGINQIDKAGGVYVIEFIYNDITIVETYDTFAARKAIFDGIYTEIEGSRLVNNFLNDGVNKMINTSRAATFVTDSVDGITRFNGDSVDIATVYGLEGDIFDGVDTAMKTKIGIYEAVPPRTRETPTIEGTLQAGNTVSVAYEYEGGDVVEGASKIIWWRADDADGTNKEQISSAADAVDQRILTAQDSAKFIMAEVVPVNDDGVEGMTACSDWTAIGG